MQGKRRKFKDIPDDEFILAVKNNTTIKNVIGSLGYSRASGTMSTYVKNRIKLLDLDISHFSTKDIKYYSHPRYALDEILVENSTYENIFRLKKRILKENLIDYKCENCGNEGLWNGKELVLQLEHKNGIHNDHRIENLCFLCPNCHSQTETFGSRQRRAKSDDISQ